MADLSTLTRTEQQKAMEVAGADRRLSKLTAGRHGFVLARPLSAGRRATPGRHALLGLYDYDQNRSVVVVVDLGAAKVTAVEDAPAHFQLSVEEARRAEQLAKTDPAIRGFLAGRKLNALTRLYFPPWAARNDPPHRYAIVFARPSNLERRYAVVDLSTEAVAEVLTPERLKGQ